jgi:hypothetical protein
VIDVGLYLQMGIIRFGVYIYKLSLSLSLSIFSPPKYYRLAFEGFGIFWVFVILFNRLAYYHNSRGCQFANLLKPNKQTI